MVDREVTETPTGEAPRVSRYGFRLRWTFRYEMELLLSAAGYSR